MPNSNSQRHKILLPEAQNGLSEQKINFQRLKFYPSGLKLNPRGLKAIKKNSQRSKTDSQMPNVHSQGPKIDSQKPEARVLSLPMNPTLAGRSAAWSLKLTPRRPKLSPIGLKLTHSGPRLTFRAQKSTQPSKSIFSSPK